MIEKLIRDQVYESVQLYHACLVFWFVHDLFLIVIVIVIIEFVSSKNVKEIEIEIEGRMIGVVQDGKRKRKKML